MSPFDLVLFIVGALLTLVGVYLFASGKMADRASKVEAFGIKLDVTNPSLILILAGVGMMLVPRLMPETPSEPPQQVAVAPAQAPAGPPAPVVTTSADTASNDTAAARPDDKPAVPAKPAAASSKLAENKPRPQPAALQRPTVIPANPKPPIADRADPSPATPAIVASLPTPTRPEPTAARPERPSYLVAAQGRPDRWKSFWDGEDEAGYSLKLARRSAERLRRAKGEARVEVESDHSGVAALMDDAAPRRHRCEAGGFAGLAVLTVAPPPLVISTVESAHWPELTLLQHDCRDGSARRRVWQLAPRTTDRFPFEGELVEDLDRAFREPS